MNLNLNLSYAYLGGLKASLEFVALVVVNLGESNRAGDGASEWEHGGISLAGGRVGQLRAQLQAKGLFQGLAGALADHFNIVSQHGLLTLLLFVLDEELGPEKT